MALDLSWTSPNERDIEQVFFFFLLLLGYSSLFQCCSMIYIQVLVGFRFLSGTSLLIKARKNIVDCFYLFVCAVLFSLGCFL